MNTKSIAIICATVILTEIFFWPTLYRYDKMTVRGSTFLVRINRLTGDTEYFYMGKWIPAKNQLIRKSKILPPDERSKVTGGARLDYATDGTTSFVDAQIYNGSSWTITEMIIRVIAKKKDGSVKWIREFKEDKVIPSLSAQGIVIATGDYNIASFEWGIEEIRGYKGD